MRYHSKGDYIPKTIKKSQSALKTSEAKKLPENPAKTIGEIFSKLTQAEPETVEKILVTLLDEDNIGMKTDVSQPRNLTRLEILGVWARIEGKPKTAEVLSEFCRLYRINRVSFNRQSREEIIRALSERFKEEKKMSEKLTEAPT